MTPDPWRKLRTFTGARIGLGRCGTSLPLQESLDFKLAHAMARDAVHQPMDTEKVIEELGEHGHRVLSLASSAATRDEYLTRPDRGKLLDRESAGLLQKKGPKADICIILCDGLSALAVHESGVPLICGLLEILGQTTLTAAPICLVKNGRVAIGDEIGSLLGARMTVTLIGERPGLSSPNSLGVYITCNPAPETTDEARNCISNIRPGGMSIADGVQKISYIVEEGLTRGKTGVGLKDKMPGNYLPLAGLLKSRSG